MADNFLPPGCHPGEGTVTTFKVKAIVMCESPDCWTRAAFVVVHHVEVERHGQSTFHVWCHQLCEPHAAQNEDAMRSIFKVKPAAVVWRDKESESDDP